METEKAVWDGLDSFFYCLLAGNPEYVHYSADCHFHICDNGDVRHPVGGVRCMEQREVGDFLRAERDKCGSQQCVQQRGLEHPDGYGECV